MKKFIILLLLAVPGCYLPQPQQPQIIERREEYREYRERDNSSPQTIINQQPPQRNIIISPSWSTPVYQAPRPCPPPHCPPPHHHHGSYPTPCPPKHPKPQQNVPLIEMGKPTRPRM